MISFDRVATNAHESYNFHEPLSYPTGSSTLPSLGGEGTAACRLPSFKTDSSFKYRNARFYLFIYLFMLNEQHF